MRKFFKAMVDKDTKKMVEIHEKMEPELEKGYSKALEGFISALENEDDRTVLYQLLNDEFTEEEVKDLYMGSKRVYTEQFRRDEERFYEKAWMEFLRYYMSNGEIKGGLDRYMEEG
ncbi:MAG: hypothetical protein U9N35_00695 [Euryarchaeota archaeon]|nr:hypothetical protein [Euryarchaeota archaeon]